MTHLAAPCIRMVHACAHGARTVHSPEHAGTAQSPAEGDPRRRRQAPGGSCCGSWPPPATSTASTSRRRPASSGMVSGWENGAPMSADYRRLFCIVYGLTEAELGFTTNDTPPPAPLGADLDPWELADALTSSTITAPTLAEMERAVLGYANRYGTTPPAELWPQVSRQMARMKDAISQPQPLAGAPAVRRAARRAVRSRRAARHGPGPARPRGRHVLRRPARRHRSRRRRPGRMGRRNPSIGPFFAQRSPPPPSCSPTPNASPAPPPAPAAAPGSPPCTPAPWPPPANAAKLSPRSTAPTPTSPRRSTSPAERTSSTPRGSTASPARSTSCCASPPKPPTSSAAPRLRSPADHKGRALLTLDLAACRVIERQDDEAGQLINTALDIAAGSLVRPIIDRAHDVRAHMAGWTGTTAAADLDARLADLAS